LLSFVAVTHAGFGSIITVRDFPEFAVAGKPLNLTFKVWVPSEEPLHQLRAWVTATSTKETVAKVYAKPGPGPEEFTVALTLPEPGDWSVEIDDNSKLPPLKVIAPGAVAPPPFPLTDRGRQLFVVKGCNACHLRNGPTDGYTYGPDLTGKRFPPDYLRRFLTDPSITPVPDEVCNRAGTICGSPYAMPSLDLKKPEIEALVVFINSSGK
jgi:hypothetical protein